MQMNKFAKTSLMAAALATALGVGFIAGHAEAYQPHMQNALGDLQAALSELQAAAPNKGGHRERAIGLVNRAITEVQAGIAVGAGM
jgi:hypothetical protein